MNLLMISGDRTAVAGKKGAFWYTLEELSNHWDRIDIICPKVPKSKRGPKANITFHPSPNHLSLQPLWIKRKGKELIEKYQHNVMTVHEYPPFYNGLGARTLTKEMKIPTSYEIHHIVGSPVAANPIELIGRWMSKYYMAKMARSATGIRTVNRTVKEQLIAWGVPEEKVGIVPSFYLDKEKLQNTSGPPVVYDVAFCARLVANKGLSNVLEALARIPEAKLLVIGEGPMRSRHELEAKRLGIENRVTFAGWLASQEDVIGALKSARMFVMNSTSEGGPRIALEAMAAGIPTISTPIGVMPDTIQDGVNGLITTGQPDDLVAKMTRLLREENLRNSIAKEAKNIANTYERSALVQLYAEWLKSLVH